MINLTETFCCPCGEVLKHWVICPVFMTTVERRHSSKLIIGVKTIQHLIRLICRERWEVVYVQCNGRVPSTTPICCQDGDAHSEIAIHILSKVMGLATVLFHHP